MVQIALLSISFAILIVAIWSWGFLRINRRRALRILCWLEGAVEAHGRISSVEWISPSQFRAQLRLSGYAFRQPSLDVRLAPRQVPLKWVMWCWRRQQETLTFEANLICPPRRSVEIGRARCTAIARPRLHGSGDWHSLAVASLFISTEPDWDPEISARMTGVVSMREFEMLGVSFRSREPHFAVTFSLKETLKHPSGELAIFDGLRELADGSPTSRT